MKSFVDIYKKSLADNWPKEAVADYGTDRCYTYGGFAAKIAELHLLFDKFSIGKGDRIALLGKNSSHWIVVFFAAVTKGAVIVPILDEFNPKDVLHILNHSEAKLFFCDSWFVSKLDIKHTEKLMAVFSLEEFEMECSVCDEEVEHSVACLQEEYAERYPNYLASDIDYAEIDSMDVVVINYTSGTTSLTKGVMLMDKNIVGNITFGTETLAAHLTRSLAILPISHVYGLLYSVLAELAVGGKVTMLAKIPSPAILLEACKEVRPTLLTLVPLIFEKIYKLRIKPLLDKPIMRFLTSVPVVNDIVYRRIGKKLHKQLGGKELYEVIIGGAAINKDVEKFLRKVRFPFLVGYGMTECAPLISYSDYKEFALESVGRELGAPRATVRISKDVHSDDLGEIQVFGDHVMKGYFKDDTATSATFTEDGWLKTGDLGCVDGQGNIYIKGRSKTMLLGPSGENIFPESIESKLMNLPFVSECIVMQNKSHKLVAFVYPDFNMLENAGVTIDRLDRLMANNRRTINDDLAKYENIQRIEIVLNPFPKTPKNTVKRYGLEYLLDHFEHNKAKQLEKSRKELARKQQDEKIVAKEQKKSDKEQKNSLAKKKKSPKAKKSNI